MIAPMLDITKPPRGHQPSLTKELIKFSDTQAEEHSTMEQMAEDTGGHAFYNTNSLADAVAKAIDAGANYYTLTYSPTDHKWNGTYRNIHVELAGNAASRGLKLAYRHGYYADDPQQPSKPKSGGLQTEATPTTPAPGALVDHAAEAYSIAAVSPGAPAPMDILFKVRVVPLTGKVDVTVSP